MITIDDYKNLVEYFNGIEIPDNLKKFVEKLNLMYEELLYRQEVQEKIGEIHKQLEKLSEEKEG